MATALFIDPPTPRLAEDRIFERATGKDHSSLPSCLASIKTCFERQGVPVHTADLLPSPQARDRYVYVSIGNHANHARLSRRSDVVLSAFFVTEAPVVEPRIYRGLRAASRRFKRIYSCVSRDEVEEIVGQSIDCSPLRWPMDFRGVDVRLWSRTDRRFLVMINMNKLPRVSSRELFTERMRAVEHFSRTEEIDLYGVGWDRASVRVGRTWLPWTLRRWQERLKDALVAVRPPPLLAAARRVYKGQLETKWETLASYDFVLCFENTARAGWLTEKIFECLHVGTIPIYLGATDIEHLIPADCFIDMRRFSGYPDLHAYLRSLKSRDVLRYRSAGRAFLESPAFDAFGRDAFAGLFRDMVAEDVGVRLEI